MNDGASIAKAMSILSQLVTRSPNAQYAPVNAGSVAAAVLRGRKDIPIGLRLHAFYLRAQGLDGARLRRADIRRCLFERVDLIGTEFIECALEGSQFIGCGIDGGTRFDGTPADVGLFSGIVHLDGGRRLEIYNPTKIRQLLLAAGAVLPPEVMTVASSAEAEKRAELVERLLKHARGHYYLSRGGQWYVNNVAGHSDWPLVERLLRANRLIEDVRFQKSGPPEVFLRFAVAPDKILRARVKADDKTPAAALQFWRELLGA